LKFIFLCIFGNILLYVKYIFLVIITLFLLTSCSITKRRYLPGYSVDWGHKPPKTVIDKRPLIAHNVTNLQLEPIAQKGLGNIPMAFSNECEVPAHLIFINTFLFNKIASNHAGFNTKEPLSFPPNKKIGLPDGVPGHGQTDKEVCKQANRSITFGILSIIVPIVILLASVGNGFEVFGLGLIGILLACIIFFTLAIINGIVALIKIHKNSEKYAGTGKAIVGMILACLSVLLLILFLSVL